MRILLFLVLACLPGPLLAQVPATLSGRITDQQGEPLAGVSVFVPGTLAATFSDDTGAYRLEDVPSGGAEVHFSLAGYRSLVLAVDLASGEEGTRDVTLRRQPFWERTRLFSTDLEAAVDEPFAPTRQVEAAGLPARSVAEGAALLPGLVRDARTDALTFQGGDRLARTIDGVPLPAPLRLPWPAVERLALHSEHVPASDAGGRDAWLDVTTRRGDTREAYADVFGSPGSPAGLVEVRGALGVPLPVARARVFVAGSWARQEDFAPAATGVRQVRADVLARLHAQPQEIAVVNPDDPSDVRYLPLPAGLPDTLSLGQMRAALDVPPGYVLDPSQHDLLRSAVYGLTDADFEQTRRRRNASAEAGHLFVRAGATLAATDFDLTYATAADARDVWRHPEALFRAEPYGRTRTRQHYLRADAARTIGRFDVRLTAATYRDRVTTFDPRFPSGIEEVMRYGDPAEAANAPLWAYRAYRSSEDIFVPAAVLTLLPVPISPDAFALPGAWGTDYAHAETGARYLRLAQATTVGGHALAFGVERQQRTRREIVVQHPGRLASFLPTPYAALPPQVLRNRYSGYDPHGLTRHDDEDVSAFVRARNCSMEDVEACREQRRIAPFRVARTGVYVSDRFGTGPVRFDLGLRVDVFQNNRKALWDPFTSTRLVRAEALPSVPRGIGEDYVIYFSMGQVSGYRSREGRFFDAEGRPVAAAGVVGRPVRLRDATGALDDGVLVDAPARVAWQPRAAVSVAVAPRASVWLAFTRTADLPEDAFIDATLLHLEQGPNVSGRAALPNAALQPEVATTYALGGDVGRGPFRFALAGAQRIVTHRPVYRDPGRTWFHEHDAFVSAGRMRVQSLSAQVAMEQVRGLTLAASYTLSRVVGEQPLANADRLLRDAVTSEQAGNLPQASTRHVATGLLRFETAAGEGRRVAGVRPFERLSLTLAVEAHGGAPYARLAVPRPYEVWSVPAHVSGSGALPAAALVHLHAARGFVLRGRTLTLFAEARNLFDTAEVRRVYGATGLPADDGYLATADGQRWYAPGTTERLLYETRTTDPEHYGLPREVRIGVRLAL